MRVPTVLPLLALLLLAACARTMPVRAPAPPVIGAEETGYASWYGHPYHGRRTAGGEVYDMNDLTAAHRTLPMGTRLMVTGLDTGQVVLVRVNDRGPFVEGRILDLSYAAARVLGADRAGVIPVRLQVVGLGDEGSGPATEPRPAAGFAVQVGAFADKSRAEALRDSLVRDGNAAAVAPAAIGGDTFFRVRLGPFADAPTARAAAVRLAARGYQAIVIDR